MIEWKNTPDLYNDYIHIEEAPTKAVKLLNKYPFIFDEKYFYWRVKNRPIIKRRPLYWYPQKSTPTEKHRPKARGKQLKLSSE